MSMPERTGNINVVTIQDVLSDLDLVVGEDIVMGDFDIMGWNLAAKIRPRESENYKNCGALFRPNYERGILIHALIQKNKLTRVLEIGFGRGYATACSSLAIYNKGLTGTVITVDPNHDEKQLNHFNNFIAPTVKSMVNIQAVKQTSDDFFKDLDPNARFDLIFIDGDHRYDQVVKDYNNAVKFIDKGYILMDDYHMPTKNDLDIDVANFVDSLPEEVERKLILTDRLLFNDDRGRSVDQLDYGMVLIPVGDIEDE